MADSKWGAKGHPPAGWQWYAALFLIVCTVEPLVATVRQAAESHIGHWPAFGLGVLLTGIAAWPLFATAIWILRREQSERRDDRAAMIYRPAVLPVTSVLGLVFKDFPSVLTDWPTWMYFGCVSVLLTGAFLLQRRSGRAWSWRLALPIGFVLTLAALAVTAVTTHALGVNF
jgi:hypothetical protein